jgi:outer membrane receptor protein involved in Fe transport
MKVVIAFISVVLISAIAYSQSGKIEGVVTDGQTGEALVGANIIIEGTFLGAATNLEGYYAIINAPPGVHRIRASMIGYDPVVVTDVRVSINQTTIIDIDLRETAFELEEVIIVAERPIVQRDVSASVLNIEAAAVQVMPVRNIDRVLALQAGVEMGSEGIIVRGGGANQTIFLVDGLLMNDERSNIPYTAVSLSSLQEIQIQTGGFNAEYGNVRSGVVNVITREGSRERYNAVVNVLYGPPQAKNFGMSIYDPHSYFNRPFMDPDVAWTGTQSGAWDEYTQRQYPTFEGWNAVSERTLEDGDPSTDLTPEQAQRLWKWQRRRDGSIRKPDYVIDVGFGGPVPFVTDFLGDMRFFATYFEEKEMFVFPLSRDGYSDQHGQLRLTSNVTPSIKLNINSLYGEIHSVSPFNWTTTPTGRVLRDQHEIANLLNAQDGASVLYMPGYYSPSTIYRAVVGAKLTHVLSSNTFYEVVVQYNSNRYNTFQTAARDTSKTIELFPGFFVDEAPFGYDPAGAAAIDGTSMGGWMNLGRDRTHNTTTSLRADLTSQVHMNHQIKTGLHFTYNDYRIRSFTEHARMDTWNREMVYNVFPYRLGAYLQNKMEYGGFIANVGVRLEYSDPNTDWYELSPFDRYFRPGYGHTIEEEVPRIPAEAYWTVSPRLGISHPITENSKLYFNYGHFRSEPASSLRFRLQREFSGLVTSIGNPALKLEKTIAYELGYEQNLFDMFLLQIAAYYKDVTDQPGWIYYENFDGSVQYNVPANNNYADIRGFEVTLQKRAGRWLTGFINYTYDVRTSGFFDLQRYYQDPTKQRDYLRLNPYQSRPQPRPYARANINIRSPRDFGPELFGIHPFGDFNINILADWRTGLYETYNPQNIPGRVNNVQWRDWYNFDLRITKDVRVVNRSMQFIMDVRNVFNIKYMSRAGFADAFDYQNYLESLRSPWREGVRKGNDRIGDYRPWDVPYDPLEPNPDNDPEIAGRNDERIKNKSYIDNPNIRSLAFLNPRHISFGVRINL